MKNNKFIIALTALLLVLFSMYLCTSRQADYKKYSTDFNNTRLRLGIPIIETQWIDIDEHPNYWVDKNTTSFHHSKMTFIDGRSQIREVDGYRKILADTSKRIEVELINEFDPDAEAINSCMCYVNEYQNDKRLRHDTMEGNKCQELLKELQLKND